jgi:para-aminobenzoate synthetase/4-amino-4-deoxychorismate lyase
MIVPTLPRRAVLLDDARPGGASRLFRDPVAWIEARAPDEAAAALDRIDRAVADGLWVAGGFAYELGYLFEPRLRPLYRTPPDPLIAVGLYERPIAVEAGAVFAAAADGTECAIGAAEPAWDEDAYERAFARIRDYIAAGDVYQINLTFPLRFAAAGDPRARHAGWRTLARAGHAAWLRLDDREVFSFSPELFLAADGSGTIRTRPMKGTAARGADAAADDAARAALAGDPKQRAENLMIVDLLRNDLARVCLPGSVRVSDLFTVETYPTLHTMTSGIEGRLTDGVTPTDLLRALFPCGSVTGAPKVRAMQIIAETEAAPRGFYCGAIGAIGPGLQLDLNVAIRTLVAEDGSGALRMGVGSGIVFDSQARAEYEECLLKARFASAAPFELLETMRWEAGAGFFFLEEHLERLAEAAAYFGVEYREAAVRAALEAHVAGARGARRVRLRLALDGRALVASEALEAAFAEGGGAIRLHLGSARVASADPFARHKTTRRGVYEAALAEAKAAGADEAVLLNEHGRVADGSFTSLFLERDGVLLTPPPAEGALDGVLKRALMRRGTPRILERALTPEDLRSGTLYAGNSVRGLMRATLI